MVATAAGFMTRLISRKRFAPHKRIKLSSWRSSGPTTCLIVALASILALSILSEYQIHPPENFLNWDVMVMLTPWGLIGNFCFDQAQYLMKFYWKIGGRSGIFEFPILGLFILTCVASTLGYLVLSRRRP